MRATCLALFAVGLFGCGKIDSSRTNAAVDASAPATPTITRPDDTARPSTTAADTASRPAPMPAPRSADNADAQRASSAPANSTQRTDGAAVSDNATSDKTTRPDNTAVNARDTDRATRDPKLPIDQKENQADIDVTAKIRQQVLKAEGMSVNARNCKIITADGRVTLRGPVNSAAERDTIAKIARDVAGDSNVDDQLEVARDNP